VPGFDLRGPYEVAHEDEVYASPGGSALLARVYRPRGAGDEPRPALVDVHGGAWSYFDRRADAAIAQGLAACGVVVISVDFRQGAEHPFPASVSDVLAAVRFARLHATRLEVDPERIGMIGGSSGGHLCLLAGVKPRAPEFQGTAFAGQDGRPVDAGVAFVLALWPIANPLERYRYLLARRSEPESARRDPLFRPEHLIAGQEGHFGDEETMRRASLSEVLAAGEHQELPPIWVAHPELDENVTAAMTERFVASYRRAGGEAELEHFAGVGHAFANFPGDAADRGISRMRAYLARRLGVGGPTSSKTRPASSRRA
jgi:acetyl esterase/lipase